ncbi:hypothetical protein SUDANB121_05637 [Nocardiopsis dassonvillei]|uniref:hypothetical protein n=1 Tax=Nocardiopsis dassonvillei TaxID=2014 RepID=UPI003F5541D2
MLLRFGLGAVSETALPAAGLLLSRGGRRAHLLAGLPTGGAAPVAVAGALVTDRAAARVVLFPLIVLILLQTGASHEWFKAAEPS